MKMTEEITLTVEEVLRVYKFLEKTNDLFHQPMRYEDSEVVKKFADDNYPEIRELYYELLWDKLPKKVQDKITGE